jgi:hypothetical protein
MPDPSLSESERAVALDARATELRKLMYRTPGLLARLDAGREAAERGEWVTLREIDARLVARS